MVWIVCVFGFVMNFISQTLYATVEYAINNVTSSLNDDLEKIIVWSNKWAIDFNPFKSAKQ